MSQYRATEYNGIMSYTFVVAGVGANERSLQEYCRDRFMLTDRYPVEDMFLCQSGMPGWLSLGVRQLQNLVTNL